jgi:succinate dehydrogenase / fumarate reductase cytochrome b subunit
VKRVASFYHSTVGKKIIMAATGAILIGFVIVHMSGNLLAFKGQESLDHYGALLKTSKPLLWTVRMVLLAAVALHIVSALQLTRLAQTGRPQGYSSREPQAATMASRTMRVGGFVLLFFIVYHLLHFTTGTVHPDFREGAVYHNLITGLRVPAVGTFYIVAMAALALHLYHGASSMFQTLGLSHPSWNPGRELLMRALAALVSLGFVSIPVAVMLGVLR